MQRGGESCVRYDILMPVPYACDKPKGKKKRKEKKELEIMGTGMGNNDNTAGSLSKQQ